VRATLNEFRTCNSEDKKKVSSAGTVIINNKNLNKRYDLEEIFLFYGTYYNNTTLIPLLGLCTA
jgi:hypothetical protein